MTISMKVFGSHKYSFNVPAKYVFKIVLVPEKVSVATGFHYVILLDTSGSMAGIKIDLARRGAAELISRIPKGNKVTLITFSSTVETVFEFADAGTPYNLDSVTAGGTTVLYTALLTAINVIKKYGMPAYVVLLTDGVPTDVTDEETYKRLEFPKDTKIIAYGIGDDYNESLLRILADATGGILEHVSDVTQIVNALPKAAVTSIGGKSIKVDIAGEGQIKLLNFKGPPVQINALEGAVTIWGEISMPANYKGTLLSVNTTYVEPATNETKTLSATLSVEPAKDASQYASGINQDLISEYNYYVLLDKYSKDLSATNLAEATKTLSQLTQLAQQTRRLDLMENTKRLQASLEQTKRLGSTESTKRLAKEVQSEVTKKLRAS